MDRGAAGRRRDRRPAPYDDVVSMLLNRPVPSRLRPAVGIGVVGRRAVLLRDPRPGGARSGAGWPGARTGVVHPGGLPIVRLSDLVHRRVADPGAGGGGRRRRPRPGRRRARRAADLLDVLGLPGGTCSDGRWARTRSGASVVDPSPGTCGASIDACTTTCPGETRWRTSSRDVPAHVVVLDYGSGNVHSAVRALERVGADVTLTGDRAGGARGRRALRARRRQLPRLYATASGPPTVPGSSTSAWPAGARSSASASGCR